MTDFENYSERESSGIEFQRASLEDAQALLEIESSTIGQNTYSPYLEEEEIMQHLHDDVIYLIKVRGMIAGSISYRIKSNRHAYLDSLIIKPEFQRKGLAREAITKVLKELGGYEKLDLVVHPDNTAAIKLYESFGFTAGTRKENPFGDGEPRLVMVRVKKGSNIVP